MVHAAHPAVHLVVLALRALVLEERAGAPKAAADAAALVHVLHGTAAELAEGDAVGLAEGLGGGQEHASVPHARLVASEAGHRHGVRRGAQAHPLRHARVDDLVDAVAEHEHDDVAVRPKVGARARAVGALHDEHTRVRTGDLGGDRGITRRLHDEAWGESNE